MDRVPDQRRELERELISRTLQGDRGAFEQLVQPYLAVLRARVRQATRNLPVEPLEVEQETLLRVYSALENYDAQYTFAQFLFGIARQAVRRAATARGREIAVAWTEESTEAGERQLLPAGEELHPDFTFLAGAARFPSPDARTRARHRFLALLAVLLRDGGYPHQQIAFGYSVLLWGKAKRPRRAGARPRARAEKVDVTGDPERVAREVGPEHLLAAGVGFRREIEAREALDPRTLDEAFRPFDHRLGLTCAELFAGDPSSRALFARLADERVSATCLHLYFGAKPERSIAEWSRAVKERVRRALLGGSVDRRAKSPMPRTEAPTSTCLAGETRGMRSRKEGRA